MTYLQPRAVASMPLHRRTDHTRMRCFYSFTSHAASRSWPQNLLVRFAPPRSGLWTPPNFNVQGRFPHVSFTGSSRRHSSLISTPVIVRAGTRVPILRRQQALNWQFEFHFARACCRRHILRFRRTGSGDVSTRRMISSFSNAEYLMRYPPHPRSCLWNGPLLTIAP